MVLTSYQVLGIVYLDQLLGSRHTHISYHYYLSQSILLKVYVLKRRLENSANRKLPKSQSRKSFLESSLRRKFNINFESKKQTTLQPVSPPPMTRHQIFKLCYKPIQTT